MHSTIKLVVLFSLLILAAGCNQGGMDLSSVDSGISSLASSSISDGGSGSGSDDSGSGSGTQVALVHNPEPATMLLWGAGLVGAALARRRKKIK